MQCNQSHSILTINLVDTEGKTLPIDLRKLVDLKENQTVTVRGKARLLAGSLLQIDADGIHVMPPGSVVRASGAATK